MTIPRLPQRLECMIYRQKLELEIEEIRPDLKTVHDACKELRASARFKLTLRVRSLPNPQFSCGDKNSRQYSQLGTH